MNTLNPYDSPPSSPGRRLSTDLHHASISATNHPLDLNNSQHHPHGQIKLIGAGPGDPDLLTVAAYKAITQWADVVLSDKLVSKEILSLIKCELFIANKEKGCQASGQQELYQKAIQALNAGKRVVRLKQGDPFIFGRGGEEYLYFSSLGYIPTIVPGLSSSIAGPLLANIPLTHRGIATQFLVCTGTGSAETGAIEVPEYVSHRTVVFLMALHRLSSLVQDLQKAGYPDDLPVAVVEKASAPDQRCLRATIGTVVQVLQEAGYRPPGILVVGKVCDALVRGDSDLLQQIVIPSNMMVSAK